MKLSLLLLTFTIAFNAIAQETVPNTIEVYRDPSCQCCHKWMQHLTEHQFNVIDHLTTDMTHKKDALLIPKAMRSCHSAIIDGYLIEGHVPANDIKRLLAERPDSVGLSVPNMPVGTPGMEMGDRKDNFAVLEFDNSGQYRVFNHYQIDSSNHYYSNTPQGQQ